VERLHPLGKIKLGAVECIARPIGGFIEQGSKVVIEEIRGTMIYVRKTNEPNPPG
jgi:membrane-bound ClpP family serine protease